MATAKKKVAVGKVAKKGVKKVSKKGGADESIKLSKKDNAILDKIHDEIGAKGKPKAKAKAKKGGKK